MKKQSAQFIKSKATKTHLFFHRNLKTPYNIKQKKYILNLLYYETDGVYIITLSFTQIQTMQQQKIQHIITH